MAEYSYGALQVVAPGGYVQFNDAIPCKKGWIVHRDDSGTLKLRGLTDQNRALYKVTFGGNISVPTGQTVSAISLAIAVEGEGLQSATMTVTPTVVEQYFNVSASVFIEVPRGCCVVVAVENTSTIPVNVLNANLIVERTA